MSTAEGCSGPERRNSGRREWAMGKGVGDYGGSFWRSNAKMGLIRDMFEVVCGTGDEVKHGTRLRDETRHTSMLVHDIQANLIHPGIVLGK